MPLLDSINQAVKKAMIARDQERLDTLRFLKSEIKYAAIEKKKESLDDAEILQVIQKQAKRRKESIEQFQKGGRTDLAQKESRELTILEAFLPRSLPDSEVEAIVRKKTQEAGASSKKDFGRMMKLLTAELTGRADARRISEYLGKLLQ